MNLEVYTGATPNGWKITIMIEELIEAGIDLGRVDIRQLSLSDGDQFTENFTKINPNQKIPAIVHNGTRVFESCAILQYLGETFPTTLFPGDDTRWQVIPWLYWQAANIGPIFGNKLSYTRYIRDASDLERRHPIERFGKEALRLIGVMDHQLAQHAYLCGDHFTIADIATFPWIARHEWHDIGLKKFKNLSRWYRDISKRECVKKGYDLLKRGEEIPYI